MKRSRPRRPPEGAIVIRREDEIRQIDREYPYQVVIKLSHDEPGVRLLKMLTFCQKQAVPFRTYTEKRVFRHFVRYCFADPTHADEFHSEFDGGRVDVQDARPWMVKFPTLWALRRWKSTQRPSDDLRGHPRHVDRSND